MPLVNTNLLVRYLANEAASGTSPTSVADASGNAYHLDAMDYGSGNMAWIEPSAGKRGLETTTRDAGGYARHQINNTSDLIRDNMHGAKQLTIECVIRADTQPTITNSRVFGISRRNGGAGVFHLMVQGTQSGDGRVYQLSWNDADFLVTWDGSSLTTRHVVTVVIDTDQATQADRARIWIDGTEVTSGNKTVGLTSGSTLSIPTDSDLIAMNRDSSGTFARSPDGAWHYGAIYAGALSSTDVVANQTLLASDDDSVGAVTLEQEGFQFGEDDGSESGYTMIGSQDGAITREADVPTILRALVNATGDPASKQFKLRASLNGGPKWDV